MDFKFLKNNREANNSPAGWMDGWIRIPLWPLLVLRIYRHTYAINNMPSMPHHGTSSLLVFFTFWFVCCVWCDAAVVGETVAWIAFCGCQRPSWVPQPLVLQRLRLLSPPLLPPLPAVVVWRMVLVPAVALGWKWLPQRCCACVCGTAATRPAPRSVARRAQSVPAVGVAAGSRNETIAHYFPHRRLVQHCCCYYCTIGTAVAATEPPVVRGHVAAPPR